MPEPTDSAMWRSVEATVRDVLLPALTDDWARVTAIQLVGMARFAATRPSDPTAARVAELTEALDRLGDNPVVASHPPVATSPEATFAAVGAVLADAAVRDDAAADEVRAVLRPVVTRHLDEDLAVTGLLMPYFRGQLPDA